MEEAEHLLGFAIGLQDYKQKKEKTEKVKVDQERKGEISKKEDVLTEETFKKEDWRESEQLSINAQAQYSAEDGGSFVGTVDFSQQFDLVNGKYRVQVVALDSSLQSKTESWDLGSLNVWFKEGRSETNNQRMNENYFLKKEIIA